MKNIEKFALKNLKPKGNRPQPGTYSVLFRALIQGTITIPEDGERESRNTKGLWALVETLANMVNAQSLRAAIRVSQSTTERDIRLEARDILNAEYPLETKSVAGKTRAVLMVTKIEGEE